MSAKVKYDKYMKQSYVYIITNKPNGTLYIGVTSDLVQRIYQHKSGTYEGFSKKYNLDKLVYYEVFEDIETAILREKKLKLFIRQWKINLIEKDNPDWLDLVDTL